MVTSKTSSSPRLALLGLAAATLLALESAPARAEEAPAPRRLSRAAGRAAPPP